MSQESQTSITSKELEVKNVSLCESPFVEEIKNNVALSASAYSAVSNYNTQNTELFESRYEKEFEHQRLIGKGGFGYVFEAKHRIDEKKYAIKRISLKDKYVKFLKNVLKYLK